MKSKKIIFFFQDNNTNTTRVEVGPQTFTRRDHEKVVTAQPQPMIMIPPRHYCIIANPVLRGADNTPATDKHGSVRVRHGDEEVRFAQEPFALYPGEKLFGKVAPLQVVGPNQALRLRCIRDFADAPAPAPGGDKKKDDAKAKAVKRVAGDEWLFEGPATYLPRVEVQVVEIIRAVIVKPNQALKLRARKKTVDSRGAVRRAGEEVTNRGRHHRLHAAHLACSSGCINVAARTCLASTRRLWRPSTPTC